jgi:group I intron endonuclease
MLKFLKKLQNLYGFTMTLVNCLEGNASVQEISNFKKKYWNQSVIYAWVNKQTYQCYIGSATKAQKRPFDHLQNGKLSNVNLQQGFHDFGKENFFLFILEKVGESPKITKSQLEHAENNYLQKIPRSLQYNIALRAFLPFLSEEAKKQLSLNITGSKNPIFGKKGPLAPGFHKKGSLNHMYGKKHTLEARKKISEKAKLYFKNQVLHYRAIPVQFQNLVTNKTTQPFSTLLIAAKFLGYNTSRII